MDFAMLFDVLSIRRTAFFQNTSLASSLFSPLPYHYKSAIKADFRYQMAPNGVVAATNGTHVNGGPGNQDPGSCDYEQTEDLNEITRRQLDEDVKAYRYDLEFSTEVLRDANLSLTAQEIRTIQFRILDLGHQIRHCQHRMEQIDAQFSQTGPTANGQRTFYFDAAPKRRASAMPANGTPGPTSKRARMSNIGTDADESVEAELVDSNTVQRLGYWMCHLCTANKWPLRDVSKMLTHFLDMHTEHDPEERCVELGNALAANRKLNCVYKNLSSLGPLSPLTVYLRRPF
jgi:hypothetical protein